MKFKICMISSHFYPVIGGAEKHIEILSKELVRKGHKVFILTQRIKGLKTIEIMEGVKIYRNIFAPKLGFLFGIFYIFSTFFFLLRKVKEYNIIHSHIFYLHIIPAVIIGKLFNKKVIVTIHCTGKYGDIESLKRIKGSNIIFRIVKIIDKFTCVNWDAQNELLDIGVKNEDIIIIPNFIEFEKFYPVSEKEKFNLRGKLNLPKSKKVVIFIGRLSPQKGVSYLISAWKEVVLNFPDAILLIIGDGILREKLEGKAKMFGLKNSIFFLGEKKHEEILLYLQSSDIFVLPSVSEGLPTVLLEAMSCGLPCVATKIGGNVDLIENGKNGILVEPENSDELADAILKLLNDEKLCFTFGYFSREKVKKYYTKDIVVSKYEELYKEILK